MTPWLVAGIALHLVAYFSPASTAFAFVAVAPWVRHLHLRRSRRDLAWFFVTLFGTLVVAGMHLRTSEVPFVVGPLVGVFVFAVRAPAFLLFVYLRDRLPTHLSALVFAAALTVADSLQPVVTPLASWGNAGYVVLEDRALLQLVAFTGLAGPGFLAHAVASLLGHALADRTAPRTSAIVFAVLLAAHAFGNERLASMPLQAETLRVATVDSPYRPRRPIVPAVPVVEAQLAALERGVVEARRAGARVVVFPEAGIATSPSDESSLRDRFARMASGNEVAIVAGWAVFPSRIPGTLYENRSAWFDERGAVRLERAKERPAPGEPIASNEPIDGVVPFDSILASTAICYDASYPDLGLERARRGIALLAIPSSDWRGIAPIHSEMAMVRGVEGGYAVVRSVRYGTSIASDSFGRIVARHEDGANGSPVMIADVPIVPRETFYERFGEWFVMVLGAFVVVASVSTFLRKKPSIA